MQACASSLHTTPRPPQDHVRQPGLAGRRNRAARSLPPVARARVSSCRQRAEGANALGLLSRRVRARCESSGNATWLQVTRVAGNADRVLSLRDCRDPALGLHVLDVNIALGNLVRLVRDEAASYRP